MRILSLDTALGACAACVLDEGAAEPLSIEQMTLERGHAEALLPLVARVMERVDGGFQSLSRVAVTVGPGSFTGLRVAVAAARAIGLAARIPVVGVSTLGAYCAAMMSREAGRIIAATVDARHGTVYVQALGPGGSVLLPAQQMTFKDAVRAMASGSISLAGSGATMLAQEAWSIGLDAVVVDASPAPDIRWVARLGLLADPETALPRPLYLRAADAQPQDNGKVARL
ncbi:MAG: tRNA (adenosine(37)-N6)-threonylcarbamoyltransferase complex dimerization subunit type 1 TsaB [Bosea sp. (in: a-proteobacteria)]